MFYPFLCLLHLELLANFYIKVFLEVESYHRMTMYIDLFFHIDFILLFYNSYIKT